MPRTPAVAHAPSDTPHYIWTWIDPFRGPNILAYGVAVTVLLILMWWRLRQMTHPDGSVRCPHCDQRYDRSA